MTGLKVVIKPLGWVAVLQVEMPDNISKIECDFLGSGTFKPTVLWLIGIQTASLGHGLC